MIPACFFSLRAREDVRFRMESSFREMPVFTSYSNTQTDAPTDFNLLEIANKSRILNFLPWRKEMVPHVRNIYVYLLIAEIINQLYYWQYCEWEFEWNRYSLDCVHYYKASQRIWSHIVVIHYQRTSTNADKNKFEESGLEIIDMMNVVYKENHRRNCPQ